MSCRIYIADYIDQIYICKLRTNSSLIQIYDNKTADHVSKVIQSNECNITFRLTSWQLKLCLTDLSVCPNYRRSIIQKVNSLNKFVLLKIDPPTRELIDYSW